MRDARRRAGLTQTELARRMGTGQSAIARWEAGERSPTVETLQRAVALCGFELDIGLRSQEEIAATRRAVARMLRLSPRERLELVGAEGRNLQALDGPVAR